MAPPNKRRRVERPSLLSEDERGFIAEDRTTFEQTSSDEDIEDDVPAILVPAIPQRIDEVHLQIQQRQVSPHRHRHREWVERRQTAENTTDILGDVLSVTVYEFIDATGSTSYSTDAAAYNPALSYVTTETQVIVSSEGATLSDVATSSEAVTSTSDVASITPADVASVTAVAETTTADPTTAETTAAETSTSDIATTTGVSTTGTTDTSLTAPAGVTGDATTTNGTVADTSTSATALSTSVVNYPTNTTIAATTSSVTSSLLTASNHTTLPAGVYLATLSGGHVETITRSNKAYVTTFADHQVSTISPKSSDTQAKTTVATSQHSITSSTSQDSTATSIVYAGGSTATLPGGSPALSSSSASASATLSHQSSDDAPSAPPGTIAGGVVGGAAGLALVLFAAMVFLRWYKRRRQTGHHALPPTSDVFSPDPSISSPRGPGMAERAGLRPLVSAVPAFFRHSRTAPDLPPHQSRDLPPSTVPGSEVGFTRLAGRKLPSAWSAGMSSADFIPLASAASSPQHPAPTLAAAKSGPPARPSRPIRNSSQQNSYAGSRADFWGVEDGSDASPGSGSGSSDPADLAGSTPEYAGVGATDGFTLSPGPQRRPTVHGPGPYAFSPASSAPPTPGGALPGAGGGNGGNGGRGAGWGGNGGNTKNGGGLHVVNSSGFTPREEQENPMDDENPASPHRGQMQARARFMEEV